MSAARGVRIAPDLLLPLELGTQTTLIVGKRGSGKTNTAGRFVEQLIRGGVPCAILDPADVWWGLKAPGSGPGLELYVFGGRHADLPLEPGGGALLADVVIDNAVSVVLSVRHLSGAERGRFVTDFAQRLLQRNQDPLHVVLEEAHEVAPQSAMPGEQVMLGAIKRLWKLGRSSGIGGTAITQRPAALHKDVTTQAEILAVHRLIGPQDVAAVREWIKYHGQAESILPELATLRDGEAFIWGPEFPKGDPIGLRRVQVLMRDTYDAAATPKAGERRAEPRELKAVDLEKLRASMAATIERQKADDPRELRKRIKELELEVARLEQRDPPVQVGLAVDASGYRLAIDQAEALVGKLKALAGSDVGKWAPGAVVPAIVDRKALRIAEKAAARAPRSAPMLVEARVAQRVLDMVATLDRRGITADRESIARWLALHPNGSRYNRALAELRKNGLLEGFKLSATGLETTRCLPTGDQALLETLSALKDKTPARVMSEILEAGEGLTREALAERLGIHPNGSRYNRALAWLRDMGVIPERGTIQATEGVHR